MAHEEFSDRRQRDPLLSEMHSDMRAVRDDYDATKTMIAGVDKRLAVLETSSMARDEAMSKRVAALEDKDRTTAAKRESTRVQVLAGMFVLGAAMIGIIATVVGVVMAHP